MSEKISFFSESDIEKHIDFVMKQTNYTREETINKLQLFNCEPMKVIREYMGIPDKPTSNKVKSVNQEIFRQIRTTLEASEKAHREKNPINIEQVVQNFQEFEDLKIKKQI
jgi:hypothetical protein